VTVFQTGNEEERSVNLGFQVSPAPPPRGGTCDPDLCGDPRVTPLTPLKPASAPAVRAVALGVMGGHGGDRQG
jgi:hypothetical protein